MESKVVFGVPEHPHGILDESGAHPDETLRWVSTTSHNQTVVDGPGRLRGFTVMTGRDSSWCLGTDLESGNTGGESDLSIR